MLPSSPVGQGTRLEEGFRVLGCEVVFLCPPGEVAVFLGAMVERSLGDMRKGCEPAVWGMAVPQCSFTSLLCVEFGFLHHPGAVWGHSLKVQSCDSACLGKVCAVPNTCAGCGPVKSTLRGAVADISHWATGEKEISMPQRCHMQQAPCSLCACV